GSNGEVREARPRGRGPRFSAVSRRARKTDLRERVEGSVAAVAAPPDDARQREPAVARRSAGAEVACRADGKALLRRGRRDARRLRAAENLAREVAQPPLPDASTPSNAGGSSHAEQSQPSSNSSSRMSGVKAPASHSHSSCRIGRS